MQQNKPACSNARDAWAQIDSLRMGMDWDEEDIKKPQILIDDVWGTTHPGSVHLFELSKQVGIGVYERGGKPSFCHVTDACDGCAMGHDGMNYILPSREIMADMVEIHGSYIPFDGMVLVSACDKSVPAHLMAAGRLDIPTIHVPGGSMRMGPNLITSQKTGELSAKRKKGSDVVNELMDYFLMGSPSCGSCQVMGTASTMQCMSEALGMALPGSALCPTSLQEITRRAKLAGKKIMQLYSQGITARKIMVKDAFENAIKVHAAISGSTNALIHIPAIAHEVGIELNTDFFNEINSMIPYLTNIAPSGKYPTELLWYAGGVPMIQWLLKDYLELDVLTVTGKTLGENLDDLWKDGFFRRGAEMLKNYGLGPDDIIRKPATQDKKGSIAVLKGNIAPEGAVIKYSAVPKNMYKHVGEAQVFDCEEDCYSAIVSDKVSPGSVLVIRYEGPKSTGMPEMYMTTDAMMADNRLNKTTAIITDGRFSGFSCGPCIGHITPEAIMGGPIALIEDRDFIEIDIYAKSINIVGINGDIAKPEEIDKILNVRRANWKPYKNKEIKPGVLKKYCDKAVSAMKGAYTE